MLGFSFILTCVAVLFFCFGSSVDFKWKALAGGLTALSLILQFACAGEVHHLVPFFIQVVIFLWMIVYWKMP
jgi:hypothetical protein